MTREEEEEVRSLLSRHQARIMLDLGGTDLLAVLVKNAVLTQSEEDLLLKSYPPPPTSAPSSVGVSKRQLSAVASSGSAGSGSSRNSAGGVVVSVVGVGATGSTVGDYTSSIAGSSANNSRSASVNGDHVLSDNCSITPSVGGQLESNNGTSVAGDSIIGDLVGDYSTKEELQDATLKVLRLQCDHLIDIIAKSGFDKFKQFCYAIESECPRLIEDLINDRLKCGKSVSLPAYLHTYIH